MQINRLALMVAAALAMGPSLALRTPQMPDLRKVMMSGGGKGKRKHRMSGTHSGRSPGHRARSAYHPHQGPQEMMRRAVGGFAFTQRAYDLTKADCVAIGEMHRHNLVTVREEMRRRAVVGP